MARVKGTIMLPLVKSLRAALKDPRDRLPEHLHRYLDERVLVSEWYEEEDHLLLLRVLGAEMGMTANYEPMGAILAQVELGGVYRGSLHEGDIQRTLRSFVNLWPQNHDTGTVDLALKDTGFVLTLTGYAIPAREICDIVTGYLVEGLRMASGEPPTVRHVRCRTRGSPACAWDIRPAKGNG